MDNYKLSEKAATDLAELYEYGILTFGLSQAESYFLGLHERFQILTENTKIGRPAIELAPHLRRFEYQSHVIFYQPEEAGVLIARVLREEMDFKKHFQAE